ncbi:hypothetical protein LZZ90_05635, partial [Flavobacterium sp. SM15]|uniref:PKD-like domain-containing protein n=1 Tax=Flavobacterium sp. SM15 TaxID=2908005 RepID=UPI00272ED513
MMKFYKQLLVSALLILFINNAYAQPSNDNCSNATNLGTLPAPAACTVFPTETGSTVTLNNQTTVAATGASPYSYLTNCSGGGNMQAPALDVWYTFVASGSTVNVTINGFPNASIGVWSGNNCNTLNGVACGNLGGSGNGSVVVNSTSPGQTYYVQVSGGTTTATDNNFSISVNNSIDCDNCLRTSTLVPSPLPVNGAYTPGQVVHFCYTVTEWEDTNTNWFHGVQISMGPGWTGTITNATPAATCQFLGGTWAFFPTGIGVVNGTNWGTGFYFDSGDVGSDPKNNFGDDCTGTGLNWEFCFDLTVSSACVSGQDLSVTINTSGDGESGSWTSPACQLDPPNTSTAVMQAGPVMTSPSTATVCSGGTVNIPLTSNVPATYTWIATNNASVTGESTTLQSTSTLSNILVNSSGVNQVVTYTVTPTSTPGGCAGSPQTVLVTVTPAPTANAGTDTSVCSGGCVSLSGTSSVAPGTFASNFSNSTVVAIPSNNTTGANTSITASGAVASATTIGSICFTIDHSKAADIGNNGNPNAITITMPDGTVYNSTLTPLSGSGVQTFCIPPAVYAGYTGTLNGTFTLNVKDTRGGGGGTGDITNLTVVLNTNSISWSPKASISSGVNTLTPSVCPTGNTTYILTVVAPGGCVITDTVDVTVGLPTAPVVGTITQPTCTVATGSV